MHTFSKIEKKKMNKTVTEKEKKIKKISLVSFPRRGLC